MKKRIPSGGVVLENPFPPPLTRSRRGQVELVLGKLGLKREHREVKRDGPGGDSGVAHQEGAERRIDGDVGRHAQDHEGEGGPPE